MLARTLLAAMILMLALAEPGAVQSPPDREISAYFWRVDRPTPVAVAPTPTPLGTELEEAAERLLIVRQRRRDVERLERAMRELVEHLDAIPTPKP